MAEAKLLNQSMLVMVDKDPNELIMLGWVVALLLGSIILGLVLGKCSRLRICNLKLGCWLSAVLAVAGLGGIVAGMNISRFEWAFASGYVAFHLGVAGLSFCVGHGWSNRRG